MTERQEFIADLSQKLLGELLNGALASGEALDIPNCVDTAVKAAEALYDRLSSDGYV
jgi:hypothetical protein